MRLTAPEATTRGYTPNELARVLRVSPDRIRGWISTGEMPALNTAPHRCGKPRYVILPHHLAEWEAKRSAAPPPKPARRKRLVTLRDYYPD